MSNSLQWRPRLIELRALAALLALGVAFFGGVLYRGGKALAPKPVLGVGLMLLGLGALALMGWQVGQLARRTHYGRGNRRRWSAAQAVRAAHGATAPSGPRVVRVRIPS